MEDKIEKIARKISGFKTEEEIKTDILSSVDEILFIITDEPITEDMTKYASENHPYYSLNEVKNLLDCKPARYKIEERTDYKTKIKEIDLNECIEIIKNLTQDNFNKTSYEKTTPADIYKLFDYNCKQGNKIDLYIKFSIEGKKNKRHVLIISFHREGM